MLKLQLKHLLPNCWKKDWDWSHLEWIILFCRDPSLSNCSLLTSVLLFSSGVLDILVHPLFLSLIVNILSNLEYLDYLFEQILQSCFILLLCSARNFEEIYQPFFSQLSCSTSSPLMNFSAEELYFSSFSMIHCYSTILTLFSSYQIIKQNWIQFSPLVIRIHCSLVYHRNYSWFGLLLGWLGLSHRYHQFIHIQKDSWRLNYRLLCFLMSWHFLSTFISPTCPISSFSICQSEVFNPLNMKQEVLHNI